MPEGEFVWPGDRMKDDSTLREEFLQKAQPFIRHVSVRVSHRALEWGRDEELSEAMIAFNEAIDHYEEKRGVPFLAFARLLIKRRLIDYHRKQHARDALSLDQEEIGFVAELQQGVRGYQESEHTRERLEEIQEFSRALSQFKLSFNDLVEASPKHRDTRQTLLSVARALAYDYELWEKVQSSGKIPMQALALKTGVHPKVLERGRKFILGVALILAEQNEYIYLREYVLPGERGSWTD